MPAYVLAEIHRDRRQRPRPFTLEDFMPHQWPGVEGQARPAGRRQSAAEQTQVLTQFFRGLGAKRV
jgi:hypothetical protein